jgi:hypothetical protein
MGKQIKGESLTAEMSLAPAIAINLDCVDFFDVPQNTPVSEIVYLKNVGKETLIISDVCNLESPFSLDEFELPLSIEGGNKTSFVVTITPESMGEFNSILRVTSNDPNNEFLSISLKAKIIEPVDEFAEKREEMQKRIARSLEEAEEPESEAVYGDWVTPLHQKPESRVRNYLMAFILLVLLVGAILYKYRTTAAPIAVPAPQGHAIETRDPNPDVKKHLEQSDTVKSKKIIMRQPNSYDSPARKP